MSKWKKWLQQSIAVVSVLALMAGMPPQMRAQEAENAAGTAQEQTGEGAGTTGENGEAFILGEDTTKRDENVKHFRMSDGSYTMVQYGTPVHYEKDGAWEDIDSTLSEGQESTAELAEIEGITTYAAQQPEDVYGIAGNSFDVKFAKKSNGKFLMKLKQEDVSLYWSVVSPQKNKVTGQATNGTAQSEDPMSLTRLTSQMLYADIFEDTDLQYIVTPTGVKENIIVKKAQSAYAYTFELKVKGVTLSLEEDGSIAVRNTDGSDRFVIPAPYMFDAAGDMSEAVHYELEAGRNGKTYTLRVVADESWINASGRQFPVTIDPAFMETGYDKIHDATASYASYISDLSTTILSIGHKDREVAALVHTNLNLMGKRIISAQLKMYYNPFAYKTSAGYTYNTQGMQINLYRITSDWSAKWPNSDGRLKVNEIPQFDSILVDYAITDDQAAYGNGLLEFDITHLAQQWADGVTNYGVILKADNPVRGNIIGLLDSDHPSYDIFNPESNKNPYLDPTFIVNYRDTKGIEPYWTYTSMSAGRSGSAHVNNYNGALTVVQPIASAPGNISPVSIQMIYNHNQSAWHTNYEVSIESSDLEEYPYYMIDADGTEHYFYEKDGKYVDEDGLGYTLEVFTSGGVWCKVTAKDDSYGVQLERRPVQHQ